MKLSVMDRLMLLTLLSTEGSDLTSLRVIRKLQDTVGFSEDDHKTYKITSDEKGVHWDPTPDQFKDIEIGPKAAEIIKARLQALSDDKKLTPQHLGLADMFLPETE